MIQVRHLAAAYQRWNEDNAGMMAAAVAYYLSLSLLPTLLLIASGLGLFLRWTESGHEAHSYVLTIVREQANETVAESIHHMLLDVEQMAVYSGPLGIATLLMASLAIFAQLDRAFDRIYRVPTRTVKNPFVMVADIMKYRLRAFAMLVSLGLVVLAIFVSGMAFTWFQSRAASFSTQSTAIWWGAETAVEWVMNSIVFALIYRMVPRVSVSWRNALAGGVAAALLWELGRQFLGTLFIGERYTSAHGMIGAMTGLMLWGYGGIAVLFAGAELTQVLAAESKSPALMKDSASLADPNHSIARKASDPRCSPPSVPWLRAYDLIFVSAVLYLASFFFLQATNCQAVSSAADPKIRQVVIFSDRPTLQNLACKAYWPLIQFMPEERLFPTGEQVAGYTAHAESDALRR